MNRVHPAAWIGLAINIIVAAYFASELLSSHYFDTAETVFLLAVLGGAALSLIGVLMLAAGSEAGGIVGLIGSIVFIPIGLVCGIGCMISRNRIKLGHYEQTDVQRAQEIVERMRRSESSAMGMQPDTVKRVPLDDSSANGQAAAAAPGTSYSGGNPTGSLSGQSDQSCRGDQTSQGGLGAQGSQSGQNCDSPSFSSITSTPPPAPKVAFPFYDQRWVFGLLCVACVIAIFALASPYRGVPGTLFLPLIVSIMFIVMNSRVLKWSVFAFYDDYLECVPNLYSSPLRVYYDSITRADVTRGRAKLYVRRPDGREDTITVAFGFVRGSVREEAREAFSAKMRELKVLF